MNRKVVYFLSFFLSLFLLIGVSFDFYKSLELFKSHFLLVIFNLAIFITLFNKIIFFFFHKIDNLTFTKDIKNSKLTILFKKHTFLFSFIFIIIGWLIYIIAFYPCILSPDPSFQILQFLGIDNKYSYYSILLDNNVIITNHHPVVHTILLGLCTSVGLLFDNINAGLFIYSIIQITVLASTFSYTICFMKKLKISYKYQFICLLIYTLIPVFPFYAMSPVKDVIFGCLIIVYIITISRFIIFKDDMKITNIISILLLNIFIFLFRNNGIHIIILSFPFLLILKSSNRHKILITLVLTLVLYCSYKKILLPYYKITPASIRETLSIPFQQTARYVLYYDNDVSKDEREAIDKILGYDTLASRYNPEKADSVKNEFNRFSTAEDLEKYFKVWFQQFLKHPLVYIEATLNNTYGYFYPFKSNWYIYHHENPVLKQHNFDYHFNSFDNLRQYLTNFGEFFIFIPIIGLTINIGFSTWILFFMISYLLYKRKYKEIICFIPMIVVLLVCIASPVNTYFRYALPNIFAMPTMIAIFLHIVRQKSL